MAYFISASPGMECVFTSCEHAKATVVYIHEFVNRPQKPMCESHASAIKGVWKVKELK